ncbi:Protein yippee-like protein [Monoraphidium neglectum]|uniref:Protein yippee-like protein n=1 Tax=Monoraphidium neglectum TaxID=145388 RepID=A0A0D2K863_9CHLO|nr:Protein yippee-like protein [Monoraphidium neglectum]KIZ06423.1 Protein yippee-like protein [Monoraphidium neglectum]|eukprot:XP_013905442.1 Protein yippee-like protein [Monoraphidium neglectum]
MGRLFTEYLEGRIYCCGACRQHIAKQTVLVSRQFHSKLGRAYLFDDVVNVVAGPLEERLMTTGMHIVRSEEAHEASQKYKERKFILERVQVVTLSTASAGPGSPAYRALPTADESSDEDCGV